jgi:FCD domain
VIVIRITIEYEALRRSMSLGDDAWEPAAIAAFHRLKYSIERTQPDRSFTTEKFETLHKSFHTALIAGCESARLLELHSDLYDQAARYRRRRLYSNPQGFIAEHKSLLDLVIAREVRAISRLSAHLGSNSNCLSGTTEIDVTVSRAQANRFVLLDAQRLTGASDIFCRRNPTSEHSPRGSGGTRRRTPLNSSLPRNLSRASRSCHSSLMRSVFGSTTSSAKSYKQCIRPCSVCSG